MKKLPSLEVLHLALSYDPFSGELRWRQNGKSFGCERSTGYIKGLIGGTIYPAHRIIFKMMTGKEPDTIDHIDGCKTNNKWCNLRNACHAENMKNKRLPKNNTSGHIGISIQPNGLYKAFIQKDCRSYSLGRFKNLSDAIAARRAAELSMGFHPNHGKR